MERVKNFWDAFKDIAILFSFVVNFILVVVLLVVTIPALKMVFTLKTDLVEPLLNDLDSAFVGLGEATIDTACEEFTKDYTPIKDVRGTAEYRLRTAENLLRRYFHESTNPLTETRIVGRGAA